MVTSKKTNKTTKKDNWLGYMEIGELEHKYKEATIARFNSLVEAKGKDSLDVLSNTFPRFSRSVVSEAITKAFTPFVISDGIRVVTAIPKNVHYHRKYDHYVIKVEVKTYNEVTRQADCYTTYYHNYAGNRNEKATLCQHLYDMADDVALAARERYAELECRHKDETKSSKK